MLQLREDNRLIGETRYYVAEEEISMQVPDEVIKSVVFVCMQASKDAQQLKAVGTAFLVALEEKEMNYTFGYIVTAKHVLNYIKAKSIGGNLFLRINDKNGGSIIATTNVNDWKVHPTDDALDVAVLNLYLPIDTYDVIYIPANMATTPEIIKQQSIGIGDEVFITGLFVNHVGRKRNLPVIRSGNLSLMAEEPVYTTLGETDAYLIEARSIGGLSGSPVFVYLCVVRHIDKQVKFVTGERAGFSWLGIMHGHWKIPANTKDVIIEDENEDQNGEKHTGIGIVVPATKVLEVINQPQYMDLRKKTLDELKKKNAPASD